MQNMIKQMCKTELNDSDIKAICKNRGFPADGSTSRDIFENFFISTIGIKEALNSLTYEEIVFLHLLNKINKEVDIKYFEKLYGCAGHAGGYDNRTFNQKYKETLKNVKNNLVQKGILLLSGHPNLAKPEISRARSCVINFLKLVAILLLLKLYSMHSHNFKSRNGCPQMLLR